MTKKQNDFLGKAILGLVVGTVAYAVLSRPDCRQACQSVFQPLATESGNLFASAVVGLIATTVFT